MLDANDITNRNDYYQKMFCKKIAERFSFYTEEALQFVFSAFYSPDVWEDSARVYEIIANEFTFLENEIPLLFIGGRSQNKITRKSHSVGFFVTDHVIYVNEAVLLTPTLPRVFPYPESIDVATTVVSKAIEAFDWSFFEPILTEATRNELKQLLLEAIVDILTLKKDFNIQHNEVKKSTTIRGRMIELGINKEYSIYLNDCDKSKKIYQKAQKKI